MVADARISAVNWDGVSEFVHADMQPQEVDAKLLPLPMTVMVVDDALGVAADRVRAMHQEGGGMGAITEKGYAFSAWPSPFPTTNAYSPTGSGLFIVTEYV